MGLFGPTSGNDWDGSTDRPNKGASNFYPTTVSLIPAIMLMSPGLLMNGLVISLSPSDGSYSLVVFSITGELSVGQELLGVKK
ncbi:hypothetical protein PSHT_14006 [Puccinia striiformis]|uniref:Uncharacterized protein n=1 Tax=Puccinia striiformis TaxID=27350 RepID=A0A2S4UMD4_9BASI|nr:hypothetical protein PSHT_14006 [Puccinia striiformis]